MVAALRNTVGGGKGLPYDAEVEYLESDGNSFIILGDIQTPYANGKVKFKVTNNLAGQYAIAVGTLCTPDWLHVGCQSGSFNWQLTGGWTTPSSSGDGYLSTLNTSRAGNSKYPLVLFGQNEGSSITWYKRNIRIWYFSLDCGNRSFDLIPVRKRMTGYMYDRVSGELFGNAWTGNFIIGPDKNS